MVVADVSGLSKSYKNKKVLDNISFQLNKGDIVGYLGKNGSGKTTTINILVGLLGYDAGNISILGYDISKDYNSLYGKLGIMFDENGLYNKMTVKQNLDYFVKLYKVDLRRNKSFVSELYKEMDYESIKNIQVSKLSKGMKRMVALVRTLMMWPELLILDEPFDGIDIENRCSFINLIKKYYQAKKPTIILTSHVMADIEELANRIIILKDSRIILDQSIEDFKAQGADDAKSLSEIYLSKICG
ncbi:MAG: ABC transporter ATP-binding protein [Lachnospiraceae bacterium]|nr:ABC transporter ATP-binding protein [Lachnospiraceae bacterium]